MIFDVIILFIMLIQINLVELLVLLVEEIINIDFELIEIKKVLNNSTAMNLIPCSRRYYQQVYAMKIISWFSPYLVLFACCVASYIDRFESKINNKTGRFDRFIIVIVRQWIHLTNIIFSRDRRETFIERF